MGYCGTGILDNDSAGEYIASYLDLYDEGKEHQEIRIELEAFYTKNGCSSYEDWLFLAYSQWLCGFIEEDVLQKVKEIIDKGIDKEAWLSGQATKQIVKQREKKLIKFYEKLHKTNPKPIKRGKWTKMKI